MFGFGSPAYDPIAETPDLAGKVAIVTGGNAGIGYEVVHHLAKHGAKVYLAARHAGRAEAAVQSLRNRGDITEGSIEILMMDISLVKDVQRAATEFLSKESRLDILVCNAGMLLQEHPLYTDEGLPDIFATNHFGHFLLIKLFTPILQKTSAEGASDIRIVILASKSHEDAPHVAQINSMTDIDVLKQPTYLNSYKRYALSKRFVVWYVQELQRRFEEENVDIIVMSVHPGQVQTPGIYANVPEAMLVLRPFLRFLFAFFFVSPEVGAYSTEYAATSVRVRAMAGKHRGAYIIPPNKIAPLTGQGASLELAQQLWVFSEKVVEKVLKDGKYDE